MKKSNKDKKRKTRQIVKKPENFFQEKPILIDVPGHRPFTVFMQPAKVKDIQTLNRIIHLQEKNEEDEQAAFMLMQLMVSTLDVTSEELPAIATSGLIGHFMEYNFPKPKTEDEREKIANKKNKNTIIDCFDFLIAHGHKESDIMEYPIPRFNDYISTLAERLGVKKKPISAEAAFQKLGIPVKLRGDKKP